MIVHVKENRVLAKEVSCEKIVQVKRNNDQTIAMVLFLKNLSGEMYMYNRQMLYRAEG